MTNPKTLKDIQKTSVFSGVYPVKEMLVDTGDLRAEAIKWIKEDYELVKNPESHKMLERWKDRFNISEEDLR